MDAAQIDEIAELMERRDLTRVRVEEATGSAVELERMPGRAAVAVAPAASAASVAPVAPAPSGPPVAPEPPAASPAEADADATCVTAPMVGVFYAAPAPGAEPFVREGSQVRAGDTLCVIEAMKLMNEVTAERDGEVVEVCASDGDLVEFGACLMRIR